MKNIVVIFCLAMAPFMHNELSAQLIVDGMNINEMDIQYCNARVYARSIVSKQVRVTIDYGQKVKLNASQVIESDGQEVYFLSEVALMNHMYKNGWRFLDSYTREEEPVVLFFEKMQ